MKHISNFVPSEFPRLNLGYSEGHLMISSVRYCQTCGKVYKVVKAGEHESCCGAYTLMSKEVRKGNLAKSFCEMSGIPIDDFIYVVSDESFITRIREEIRERRLLGDGYYKTALEKELIEAYSRFGLCPIGVSDSTGGWCIKARSLEKLAVFFKTRGNLMSYGQLLFSDCYFAEDRKILAMLDNSYGKETGSDGGDNLIALSLVNRMCLDETTPDVVQFRILGSEVLGKGTAQVLFDWDSRLKGVEFILGKNSAKICWVPEGTRFNATLMVSNMDVEEHRNIGIPGWEPLSWLKDDPIVMEYLLKKVRTKIENLAKVIFSGNRVVLNEMLFDPDKTEKDQSWMCQLIRSDTPADDPLVVKAMMQMYLTRCAEIVMSGGITSRLRMLRVDDTRNDLSGTGIRLPFVGGKKALMTGTIDGTVHSKDMNNSSGADADGDLFNLLDRDDGELFKTWMMEIDSLKLPAGLREEKDKGPIAMNGLIEKWIEQIEAPNIGEGTNHMSRALVLGDLDQAKIGATFAHFTAQILKKNVVDFNGCPVNSDEFIRAFGVKPYDQETREGIDWSRNWMRQQIRLRLKNKELLSIKHFRMVIEETIRNKKGELYSLEGKGFKPYNHIVNKGLLNRLLFEGSKIVCEVWDRYDMQSKLKDRTETMTDEEKSLISDIVYVWNVRNRMIVNKETMNVHSTVISQMRKSLHEEFANAGKQLDADTCRAIIKHCLIIEKSYLAEKILPEPVGYYYGWSSFLVD